VLKETKAPGDDERVLLPARGAARASEPVPGGEVTQPPADAPNRVVGDERYAANALEQGVVAEAQEKRHSRVARLAAAWASRRSRRPQGRAGGFTAPGKRQSSREAAAQ